MVKACLAVMAAILIVAAGISAAKQSSRQEDVTGPAAKDSNRQIEIKPTYVPGQVIVGLRDGQKNGFGMFSQPGLGSDQAVLLRLQVEYGLSNEGPVFEGARRRLEYQGVADSQAQGQMRMASANGPAAAEQRTTDARLSRFYLLNTDRKVPGVCAELSKDPYVEYAQPNYIYERCAEPNDPEFPDQYAHQLIQMSDAWDISTGSHDIVVAVLDTGVDANHPDLKDNIWVNKGEIPNNEIDDDNNGYIDDVSGWNFEDDSNDIIPEGSGYYSVVGHGTQVSGVIAAVGDNNEGVCGVNWHGSIMALRLSTYVTSAEVAEALDYAAANGARVANMSFGSDEFGPEGDPIVKTAIDNAFAQGVLLVASAGNDDSAIPNYPAAYYNVMAVASTNGEDIKTGHSSFGS